MLRIARRLRRSLAPEAASSQLAFFGVLDALLASRPVWLDLGCGRALVPRWLAPEEFARFTRAAAGARVVVGLDCDERSLLDNRLRRKVRGDIGRLPFRSGAFDLVTANMVVEHLSDPSACLREIGRVLKPGGIFVLHTPNMRSPLVRLASVFPDRLKRALVRVLEGRSSEDVFPAVYRLNTEARIRESAAASGLRVERLTLVPTAPMTQALGPLVVFELLLVRLLRRRALAGLRPDIIAVLSRVVPTARSQPRARAAAASGGAG